LITRKKVTRNIILKFHFNINYVLFFQCWLAVIWAFELLARAKQTQAIFNALNKKKSEIQYYWMHFLFWLLFSATIGWVHRKDFISHPSLIGSWLERESGILNEPRRTDPTVSHISLCESGGKRVCRNIFTVIPSRNLVVDSSNIVSI